MRAKTSKLKLIGFHILKSEYEFIVPDEKEVIPQKLFDSYSIDIDFSHHPCEELPSHIQVFVQLKINHTKKKAGYSFIVRGMGLFKLVDKKMNASIAHNLRIFSTLNMVINNLRNIIAQQTAFAPIGVYLLPPIDIQDLFRKKVDKEKREKKY